MLLLLPVVAEIADKVPSTLLVGACGLASSLLSSALVYWKRWLVVLAVPIAIFSAAFLLEEVRSPDVGPAIISELGHTYVAIAYASALLPFMMIAGLLFRRKQGPDAKT